MSRNAKKWVLVAVAGLIVVWLIGYFVFSVGGATPGTGVGDALDP